MAWKLMYGLDVCCVVGHFCITYQVVDYVDFISIVLVLFSLQVHRIYRSTGASFQKAQAEFATGVLRNETVQNAAADAAASAARGAVQGQYGSNNRY
jgi:hypothetical protein